MEDIVKIRRDSVVQLHYMHFICTLITSHSNRHRSNINDFLFYVNLIGTLKMYAPRLCRLTIIYIIG